MTTELQQTTSLLLEHLHLAGIPCVQPLPWGLAQSPLGGRGVVATRDIAAGEILFYDAPLVVGPRAGLHSPPLCVGCHEGVPQFLACSKGCGLPVCSRPCEGDARHVAECNRLRSWGSRVRGDTWSPELLRATMPVRCLALNPLQRRVLQCLQSHNGPQHAFEVDLLKRNIDTPPSQEDEDFMRLACCAMDANAFETAQVPKEFIKVRPPISTEEMRPLNGSTPSLRGLYPLAAMMNHACTPNTLHGYDENQRMVVRATLNIPAGAEVTNSYTALLWGSPARRHHLQLTKHFQCACPRCGDAQEGGSRLAALMCPTQTCKGSMFPMEALDEESNWRCERCGREVTGRQSALTQSTLGRLLGAVNTNNPTQMERFLKEHHQIVPTSNQIVVEIKCSLIRIYGHRKGFLWTEVGLDKLELKEMLCRELLGILQKLQAGQCRMRGLLLYELHCTLMEMYARTNNRNDNENNNKSSHYIQESLGLVEESAEILSEDITAPLDLMHRLQVCREMFKMTS